MKPFVKVYHLSEDKQYLVEVKEYRSFTWAIKWAKNHPEATVYTHRYWACPSSTIGWTKFIPFDEKPNLLWVTLTEQEAEDLPERLDSE